MTFRPFHSSLFIAAVLLLVGRAAPAQTSNDGAEARAWSVIAMSKIAEPVLVSLSEHQLAQKLPVLNPKRNRFAPLEALGRLLSGMAPWLELGPGEDEEGRLRARYIGLAVKGIGYAVAPQDPDFMNFTKGVQPLVDTAFLAQALLRAPVQLWGNLGPAERANLVAALKSSRVTKPGMNNWLLFSASVEAALWEFTGECNTEVIEFAVKKHLEWYKGDGAYGDGPDWHWDYYNSYVIQPMLLDVLRVCDKKRHPLGKHYALILERAKRYAAVQERLISPEGTFPVIGRSSVYRFGAFQTLSQIGLLHQLPEGVEPAAVRAGLTTVIRRMLEAPGAFDQNGWLRPGACGFQPSLGEYYISTGSLYLCSVGLLQLGLPADDPFWSGPDKPWTQKRIWAGEDIQADHAIKN